MKYIKYIIYIHKKYQNGTVTMVEEIMRILHFPILCTYCVFSDYKIILVTFIEL